MGNGSLFYLPHQAARLRRAIPWHAWRRATPWQSPENLCESGQGGGVCGGTAPGGGQLLGISRKTFAENKKLGRPNGICRVLLKGVNRRFLERQRRKPPPHRGLSPLWKKMRRTTLCPTTPKKSRILGRGRLWGNRRFLPHLSEAETRPQASACFASRSPPK